MGVVSGLVLYAVIWFLTLFVVLPFRMTTQGDVGERVEGTPAGAPATGFSMKRKAWVTTLVASVIFAVVASVIIWGGIGVRDIDLFHRMRPASD
jgi:predicted secreted protein